MSTTALCERCGDVAELNERRLCDECDELGRPLRERRAKLERQWKRIHKGVFGICAVLGLAPGFGVIIGVLAACGLAYVNVAFLAFERRWIGWKHIILAVLAPIALAGLTFVQAMIVFIILR